MGTPSLLIAGTLSIATGLAFGVACFLVAHTKRTADARLAGYAHATWWGALGFYLVLQGALTVAAWQDALTADTYRAWRVAAIPALCAAVWGLSTYLVYLFTGRNAAVGFMIFYAAAGALFYYVTFWQGQDFVVGTWLVGYEQESALQWVVYIAMGLPPVVGSIAYLFLLRKVRDPMQRFRIKLVGASILAYVGTGIIVRTSPQDWVVFVTLVPCGVIAALAVLVAHLPPAWLANRIQDSRKRQPPMPDDAFARRLRELI